MTTKTLTPLEQREYAYNQIDALRSNDLKDLKSSPALFHARKTGDVDKKDSYTLDFGTKIHAALLEPQLFDQSFMRMTVPKLPHDSFEKVKGRCKWEITDQDDLYTYFALPNSDPAIKTVYERLEDFYERKLILGKESAKINRLINELKLNPRVSARLTGKIEPEVMFESMLLGIPCKARADVIINESHIIDYKTTESAIKPKDLLWQIKKWGYHISAAFYVDIIAQHRPVDSFSWIFQNKYTGQCCVYKATPALLDKGREVVQDALELYNYCKITGIWADYYDPITKASNYEQDLDGEEYMNEVFA